MSYNSTWYKEYYRKNKDKKIVTNKKWKETNPEKLELQRRRERCRRFRRIYGISLEDYEEMSEKQNHLCLICQKPEEGKRLAVDHCHNTKIVRGLLCAKCNQGIGHFDDDIDLMLRAIEYVRSHNSIRKNS